MTQTFQVPDTIPLSKVREFLADLGIDVAHVIGFTCGVDGVHAELYATDADGRRYFAPGANEAAKHHISIRLDHNA